MKQGGKARKQRALNASGLRFQLGEWLPCASEKSLYPNNIQAELSGFGLSLKKS